MFENLNENFISAGEIVFEKLVLCLEEFIRMTMSYCNTNTDLSSLSWSFGWLNWRQLIIVVVLGYTRRPGPLLRWWWISGSRLWCLRTLSRNVHQFRSSPGMNGCCLKYPRLPTATRGFELPHGMERVGTSRGMELLDVRPLKDSGAWSEMQCVIVMLLTHGFSVFLMSLMQRNAFAMFILPNR